MAPQYRPEYRLDGFRGASPRVEEDFATVRLSESEYTTLACHHRGDGRDNFLLFHDRSAIFDVPGTAAYLGMHLERDPHLRTFTFDVSRQPTVPLAQNWLITRGCPPDAIEPDAALGPRPADALTTRLEEQLRHDNAGRYTLLEHYTHDLGSFEEGPEVSLLLHDAHPDAAQRPYRVFLEETTPSLETYTVREGAFPTAEAATTWLLERDTPLPPAPQPASTTADRRAAALRRTTTHTTANPQPTPHGNTAAPGRGHTRSRGRS